MNRNILVRWKSMLSICVLGITLCACGTKQNNIDIVEPDEAEQTSEKVNVSNEEADITANTSDIASTLLAAFIKGDEKVYTDKYEFTMRVEDDDPFDYFGNPDGYSIADFFKQVVDTEKKGYEPFPFERAEYAYIDCGMDGVPELVLKAYFSDEWDHLEREYVIKMVDDKLELTYMNESYYRSYTSITNTAGVVTDTGSAGAANSFYKIGFLNKDGRYVIDYSENINYEALYMLGRRFDDAVVNTNEDYSELYLKRYAFEDNEDGNTFDEYEAKSLYCAQKEPDEESNGVDFKENERVAQVLFDYIGETLYSLDDIKEKITEREISIGLTDEIKNAPEITYTELELDNVYINGCNDETAEETVYMEYIYMDSLDNFQWENPNHLCIVHPGGTTFHLDSETVLTHGIPCNDDDCDPITWANRYIEHCAITDESDPNGPYYCQGFGGTDEWQVMIDEDNNIKEIIDVFTVD